MSRYDSDPRVRGYGPDQDHRISSEGPAGFTVTRDDGSTYRVLHTEVFGWTVCQGPNLDFVPASDGGFAIGFPSADAAISAVLADQDTAVAADADAAGDDHDPHHRKEHTTVTRYDDLTPAQSRLHDEVLDTAGIDGADCRDVLDSLDAPAADKAAVAEVLGGPGAGAEYLQADQDSTTAGSDRGAEDDSTPDVVDDSAELDWPTPQEARQEMLRLADRCEKAAEELTYEGEHAAEVLAERGYPDADAQGWAARKQAAAAAAREYAAGLRTEAASLDEGGRPSDERLAQAEKVALGAEMGGILIDGARLDAAALDSPWNDAAMKQAIRDHAAAKRAAVEGSGLFEHVAEDGQVPYWQLGHADQAQDIAEQTGSDIAGDEHTGTPAAACVDDDHDGM
jgi:hypothetical protein